MTLPRLQGWFDEIQQPLQNLVSAADEALHPNKKLQKQMRDLVAANPQILQQLADMRTNDPDILKRMGLGNIEQMVVGLPESTASIKDKQTRQFLQSPNTVDEEAQIRANAKGIRDPLETERMELDRDMAIMNRSLQRAFAPLVEKEVKVKGGELDKRLEQFTQVPLGIAALRKLKGDYANRGLLTPEELNLLSSHPDFKEEFDRMRDDFWEKDRQQFSSRMSQSERQGNMLFAAVLKNAEEVADYGSVPYKMAFEYSMLPVDKQLELLNATAPKPGEEGVWSAAQGTKLITSSKKIKYINQIVDMLFRDPAISGSLKTLSTGKSKDKAAALSILNGALAARAAAGELPSPPVWEAQVEDGGWFKRDKVTYTLKTGDLALAQALGAKAGIDIDTPGQAQQKKQALDDLNNPAKLNNDAKELAGVLDQLPDEKARQDYLNAYAATRGAEVYSEIRKLLPKYRKTR